MDWIYKIDKYMVDCGIEIWIHIQILKIENNKIIGPNVKISRTENIM